VLWPRIVVASLPFCLVVVGSLKGGRGAEEVKRGVVPVITYTTCAPLITTDRSTMYAYLFNYLFATANLFIKQTDKQTNNSNKNNNNNNVTKSTLACSYAFTN